MDSPGGLRPHLGVAAPGTVPSERPDEVDPCQRGQALDPPLQAFGAHRASGDIGPAKRRLAVVTLAAAQPRFRLARPAPGGRIGLVEGLPAAGDRCPGVRGRVTQEGQPLRLGFGQARPRVPQLGCRGVRALRDQFAKLTQAMVHQLHIGGLAAPGGAWPGSKCSAGSCLDGQCQERCPIRMPSVSDHSAPAPRRSSTCASARRSSAIASSANPGRSVPQNWVSRRRARAGREASRRRWASSSLPVRTAMSPAVIATCSRATPSSPAACRRTGAVTRLVPAAQLDEDVGRRAVEERPLESPHARRRAHWPPSVRTCSARPVGRTPAVRWRGSRRRDGSRRGAPGRWPWPARVVRRRSPLRTRPGRPVPGRGCSRANAMARGSLTSSASASAWRPSSTARLRLAAHSMSKPDIAASTLADRNARRPTVLERHGALERASGCDEVAGPAKSVRPRRTSRLANRSVSPGSTRSTARCTWARPCGRRDAGERERRLVQQLGQLEPGRPALWRDHVPQSRQRE